MADLSDVEQALADLIAGALYPDGPDRPSAAGPLCRIYRGWPSPAALDADLVAGNVNVTVFPAGAGFRDTTRYPVAWSEAPQEPPTLTAAVAGDGVTFGGSADPGQIAGLIVDDRTYAYSTAAGDTPELVAAQLAAQARAARIVTLSGGTLSVPGASRLAARVVAGALATSEIRRQTQDFRVTCWCPTPASRDAASVVIDVALASTLFLKMPDGSQARLTYAGGSVVDRAEDAQLYRRDLVYTVEYATTLAQRQPAMLFGDGVLNAINFIG
jgi:hypothetical protein